MNIQLEFFLHFRVCVCQSVKFHTIVYILTELLNIYETTKIEKLSLIFKPNLNKLV